MIVSWFCTKHVMGFIQKKNHHRKVRIFTIISRNKGWQITVYQATRGLNGQIWDVCFRNWCLWLTDRNSNSINMNMALPGISHQHLYDVTDKTWSSCINLNFVDLHLGVGPQSNYRALPLKDTQSGWSTRGVARKMILYPPSVESARPEQRLAS